jgi:hypothetical protein
VDLWTCTNVSEKDLPSLWRCLYVSGYVSPKCLQLSTSTYGVTTQKKNIDFFIAVRTWNIQKRISVETFIILIPVYMFLQKTFQKPGKNSHCNRVVQYLTRLPKQMITFSSGKRQAAHDLHQDYNSEKKWRTELAECHFDIYRYVCYWISYRPPSDYADTFPVILVCWAEHWKWRSTLRKLSREWETRCG